LRRETKDEHREEVLLNLILFIGLVFGRKGVRSLLEEERKNFLLIKNSTIIAFEEERGDLER